MYREKLKILRINKAIIFISLVSSFLLLGNEIFAASCSKTDWNKTNCDVTINYTDPCPDGDCSGLSNCLYAVKGGIGSVCPSRDPNDSGWISYTCSGSAASSTQMNVIGPIGTKCDIQGSDSCKICSMAVDNAGNMSEVASQAYDLDYAPPDTIIVPDGVDCANSSASFKLTCTDSGSGCKQVEYKIVNNTDVCDAVGLTIVTGSIVNSNFTCAPDSICIKKVCYRSVDNILNVETIQTSKNFKIDQKDPVQTAWSPELREWGNTDVSVSVQYSDSDCGMENVKYCWVAAGGSCTPSVLFSTAGGGTITKSDSGGWKLCVTATDKANNFITECKEPYEIDKEAPITVISPDGSNWKNTDIPFTLTCTDNPLGTVDVNNSGCETSGGTEYKIIDSGSSCDTLGLTIGTAGTVSCPSGQACQKRVCFRSRDKAGNIETIKRSDIFKIDKVVPFITSWTPSNRDCNGANTDISINIQSADSDSGMLSSPANTKYCWTKGGSCSPGTSFSASTGGSPLQPSGDGNWTLCVMATDYAGNSSVSECKGPYKVDKTPPGPPSMTPPSRPWLNTDVSVAVTYTDADSNFCGIAYIRHCWTTFAACDPGTTDSNTILPPTQTQEGQWTLCTRAKDGAGNWTLSQCSAQGVYQIDKISPVFQSRNPTSTDWGITNISVVVNYTDPGYPTTGSGVKTSSYCWTKTSIPCNPTNAFTNNTAISQSENGEWMLCTNAIDWATNLSTTDCSDPGAYKKHATPICGSLVSQTVPEFPNSFIFTGCGSDPDGGTISQYEFDFGDGTSKILCPGDSGCFSAGSGCYSIGYTYNSAGNFCAKLKIKDDHNVWSSNTGVCPSGYCTAQINSIGNNAPVLSWTGEGNYIADGLNPEVGKNITNFVYRIKYTDQENDAPNFVKVHIKKGGIEITGSSFAMAKSDLNDNTYTDGVIYTYTKTGLIEGIDYSYYFEAQDIKESNASPTSEIIAPIVDNTPPISQFVSPDEDSSQSANFNATTTDIDTGGSGLDTCWYYVTDSVAGRTRDNTERVICNGSFPITVGPDQDCRTSGGTCSVFIFACDKAGNCGSHTWRRFKIVISDGIPPATVIDSPLADSWHKTDFNVVIKDSDAGGSGLAENCEYSIVDSDNNRSTGTKSRPCRELSTVLVKVGTSTTDDCLEDRTVPIGQSTCRVSTKAYDNAGLNSGWQSRLFKIDYTVPTVGKISCASISGQSCYTGSDCTSAEQGVAKSFCASLRDQVGHIDGCGLYIDGSGTAAKGATFSPIPCENGTNCNISVNYTFLTSGDHTMKFKCWDAADNTGSGVAVSVNVTANNAPVIDSLRYTTSPCDFPNTQSDCMVNFFVSASDADGDPLTYSWDLGDGSHSLDQNPSHHYSNIGTYSAIVTVSDSRGNTVSRGISVPVVDQDPENQCIGELPSCPACSNPICQSNGIWGCSVPFGGCSSGSCLCPTNRCVGPNYYSYKSIYGVCQNSCDCNVGTGLGQPCEVTITPNSLGCTDLSVDLKVSNNLDLTNPINWVNSLSNLTVNSKFSLIAIVSGSAAGTVNFKFDINSDGVYEKTFSNVSFTGYADDEWQSISTDQGINYEIKRLVGSDIFIVKDLVSYSQSGTHNPKVVVERGEKSAEDSVVVGISSTPPNVIIECDSGNLGLFGTCGIGSVCNSSEDISYNRNCIFRYNNKSTDSGGDITKSVWSIFYSDGTPWADPYLSCTDIAGTDGNEAICDLTLPPLSASKGYNIRLRVEDAAGASGNNNRNLYVRREIVADFDCSRAENGEYGDCESLISSAGEKVYFMDKSLKSEGAELITDWLWTFEDGTSTSYTDPNPSATFEKKDADSGKCNLEIKDNVGRQDAVLYQVYPRIPLPSWQEVLPTEQSYFTPVCDEGCDLCSSCILGNCISRCGSGYECDSSGVCVEEWTCGSSVNFTYKGNSVTYGTVTGVGGKCWMDRNLGASRVATLTNDANAYGDLFQWGRLEDGHQARTSVITTTLSDSDSPGHGSFIYGMSSPYDWRSSQNDNLWQGVLGINNPCPSGWRIPTSVEWDTERASWSSQNYTGAFNSILKLTPAGYRSYTNALLIASGLKGYYWSSSVSGTDISYLYFATVASITNKSRAEGLSVRCIKN